MAMLRSALGRVARRLSASSVAPSAMCRCGLEVLQAPTSLRSLRTSAQWTPRFGPAAQLMRTFTSPAAAAAAARTGRIPNLQGQQHVPVISKGTEGMKWAQQKRFLSLERKTNGAEGQKRLLLMEMKTSVAELTEWAR